MSVFVDTPLYPDVPFGIGVPAVLRLPGAALPLPVAALVADVLGVFSAFLAPQWGLFSSDTGGAVLVADSVISVDYRSESRISDYPVEQGGFMSYDKVALPYDARIRFVVDSLITRSTFLQDVDDLRNSLDLFTVVTPDAIYDNANVVHCDYRRETRNGGASMIVVDVWLEEVRQTGTTQFAKNTAQSPGGATRSDGGTVQPVGVDTNTHSPTALT